MDSRRPPTSPRSQPTLMITTSVLGSRRWLNSESRLLRQSPILVPLPQMLSCEPITRAASWGVLPLIRLSTLLSVVLKQNTLAVWVAFEAMYTSSRRDWVAESIEPLTSTSINSLLLAGFLSDHLNPLISPVPLRLDLSVDLRSTSPFMDGLLRLPPSLG